MHHFPFTFSPALQASERGFQCKPQHPSGHARDGGEHKDFIADRVFQFWALPNHVFSARRSKSELIRPPRERRQLSFQFWRDGSNVSISCGQSPKLIILFRGPSSAGPSHFFTLSPMFISRQIAQANQPYPKQQARSPAAHHDPSRTLGCWPISSRSFPLDLSPSLTSPRRLTQATASP